MKAVAVILLLITLIGGFLVATLPAERAVGWAASRVPNLSFGQSTGTIWNGEAQSLAWAGRSLGDLRWELQFIPLLTGRIVANLDLRGADLNAQSSVESRFDASRISLTGVQIQAPAEWLAVVYPDPWVQFDGHLGGQFEQVELDTGRLTSLIGTARWDNAAISGRTPYDLVGYEIAFNTMSDQGIVGNIRDLGGPLAVAGAVSMGDQAYQVDLALTSRKQDPELAQLLNAVASSTGPSQWRLRWSGPVLNVTR